MARHATCSLRGDEPEPPTETVLRLRARRAPAHARLRRDGSLRSLAAGGDDGAALRRRGARRFFQAERARAQRDGRAGHLPPGKSEPGGRAHRLRRRSLLRGGVYRDQESERRRQPRGQGRAARRRAARPDARRPRRGRRDHPRRGQAAVGAAAGLQRQPAPLGADAVCRERAKPRTMVLRPSADARPDLVRRSAANARRRARRGSARRAPAARRLAAHRGAQVAALRRHLDRVPRRRGSSNVPVRRPREVRARRGQDWLDARQRWRHLPRLLAGLLGGPRLPGDRPPQNASARRHPRTGRARARAAAPAAGLGRDGALLPGRAGDRGAAERPLPPRHRAAQVRHTGDRPRRAGGAAAALRGRVGRRPRRHHPRHGARPGRAREARGVRQLDARHPRALSRDQQHHRAGALGGGDAARAAAAGEERRAGRRTRRRAARRDGAHRRADGRASASWPACPRPKCRRST